MKNLRLSVKVGILVGVLLATVLIVALVGVVQVTRLAARFDRVVNTTSHAVHLSGDGRIELLTTVRSEKNAMLVPDKARATEFAEVARQSLGRAKDMASELETIIGVDVATPEGKAMSEMDRAMEEFETNDKELLQLAVMKSNVEGAHLVFRDLYRQVRDLEDYVDSLGARAAGDRIPATAADPQAAGASGSQSAKQTAGRQAIDRFYALLFRLALHLQTTDEQEKTRLDGEIRQGLSALQEALRRFSATLNEAERSDVSSVLSSSDVIKTRTAQAQQLSRTDSDNLAREMSITRGVSVGNRANALFDAARKALKAKMTDEVSDAAAAAVMGRNVVIAVGLTGSLIALVLAFVTIRSITRPVGEGVKVFEAMAAGDLTRRLNLDRHDEIGRLGSASDRMGAALSQVVAQIRGVGDRLGNSSAELATVSNDLLSQSHEMTTQAESVAAGTEQMSTNVATMAAAAEQMSVNVSGISSASEEVSVNVGSIVESAGATSRSVGSVAESIGRITSSLNDVARDARHGSQMTQQAKDMATAATAAMRQLDQSASEINKVTEVIKSIALQTNLLALNATIEATSAGDAGKGFAVVASEVKELASQSAHSAEEIAQKIEGVQTSTREAVKVIESMAQFVDQVNVSASRISEAVDGQTQTAGQIVSAVSEARQGVESIARSIAEVGKGATDVSRNTAEAANAATDVSRNASEAAKAAETISSNIQGVSEATKLNTAAAVKLNEAAKQLKELAAQLQQSVSRFQVGEQASASRP